jgi:hypothetical protein
MNKPQSLTILGKNYKISYHDKPSEVDHQRRHSCFGSIDTWDHTIRVYDDGTSIEEIWDTLLHEVLHAIGDALKLDILDKGTGEDTRKHEELGILALALSDTLIRNNLLKIDTE